MICDMICLFEGVDMKVVTYEKDDDVYYRYVVTYDRLSFEEMIDRRRWCDGYRDRCRAGIFCYYFKDEELRNWFVLRWS